MPEQTFSQKLQWLEDIVKRLESTDLELEEGLKLLEEGVALHQQCQVLLTQTEEKISKLLSPSPAADNAETPTKEPATKQASLDDLDEGLPF